MINADILTFQEFAMQETLPLSKILGAVLEFLQGREDALCSARKPSGTDWRDLAVLLLQFPEFKSETGAVSEILGRRGVDKIVLDAGREIVAQDLRAEDEDLIF